MSIVSLLNNNFFTLLYPFSCRQLRSGAMAMKEDPLDNALGSMSTKDLYRMLQLLDVVEERRRMESAAPKQDLSQMLALLQMVDQGPRYDQKRFDH